MMSGFSLIILAIISVLNNVYADDDGHHHHVIIHVPYKIHTIHHIKHIHHQKKGDDEDKYEVLGYTIGKPIDLSHQLGGHHHESHLPPPPLPPPAPLHHHEPPPYHHHLEEPHHQEFSGGNELGYGREWAPSFGQFHGDGYHSDSPHFDSHSNFAGGPEFAGHHESFDGYD